MTSTDVQERVQDDFTLAAEPPTQAHAMVLRQTPAQSIEEVREAMRLLDDAQILDAEIGHVDETWIYRYQIAGKWIEGVSVTGAMQIARIRAGMGAPIRFDTPIGQYVTQNGEAGMLVILHARAARTGGETVAMVFEPFELEVPDWEDAPNGRRRKTGKTHRIKNEMPERKALSKCKRNCVLDLIPETEALAVLRAAVGQPAQAKARVVTPRAPAHPKQEVKARVVTGVPETKPAYPDGDAGPSTAPAQSATPVMHAGANAGHELTERKADGTYLFDESALEAAREYWYRRAEAMPESKAVDREVFVAWGLQCADELMRRVEAL